MLAYRGLLFLSTRQNSGAHEGLDNIVSCTKKKKEKITEY